MAEGADIIDVGGESTRPGSAADRGRGGIGRVLPVVEGLRSSAARRSRSTPATPPWRGAARRRRAHRQRHHGAGRRSRPVPTRRRTPRLGGADAYAGRAETMHRRRLTTTSSRRSGDFLIERAPGLPGRRHPPRAHRRRSRHRLRQERRGQSGADREARPVRALPAVAVLVGVSRKSFIGRLTGIDDPRRRRSRPRYGWPSRRGRRRRAPMRRRPRRRRHPPGPSRSRRQCDKLASMSAPFSAPTAFAAAPTATR